MVELRIDRQATTKITKSRDIQTIASIVCDRLLKTWN